MRLWIVMGVFGGPTFRFFGHPAVSSFLGQYRRHFRQFNLDSTSMRSTVGSTYSFFGVPVPEVVRSLAGIRGKRAVFTG